jgi:hypothetical protein
MVSMAGSPPASHRPSSPPPASERLSLNPLARIVGFLRRFWTDYIDILMVFSTVMTLFLVILLPLSAREDAGTNWTLAAQSDDPEQHAAPPVVETWETRCVYPVSGTYARFQRILFSAVIIAVVIHRSHRWVVVAGSAWLAGYFVPAVVHAMVLTFRSSDGLDADFFPLTFIMGIVVALGPAFPHLAGYRAAWLKLGLHIVISGAAVCFFRAAMEWEQAGHWVVFEADRFYDSDADVATLFGCENICDVVQIGEASVFRGIGDRLEPTSWTRSSRPHHTSSETTFGKMVSSNQFHQIFSAAITVEMDEWLTPRNTPA